ncbi:UNVERIFIED_CONTAM: hypothetical protein FKN15_070687 [Acipenser sinensis]
MVGVKRTDHISNELLRKTSKVKDAVNQADQTKKRWAGHVAKRSDGRWTRAMTEWLPLDIKRPLGRPATRWRDSLRQDIGRDWMVKDAVNQADQAKKRWAGHVARRSDGRWTRAVTEWLPLDIKRPLGRPATRWRDSLRQDIGRKWMGLARDQKAWRSCCGLRRKTEIQAD